MPVGLQVVCQDGSGALQIDGSYQNLHLRRKGSSATTAYYLILSGANVTFVTVNFGGGFSRRPLIALNCPSLATVGAVSQNSDGTWQAQVLVRGELGASFDWYAFDLVQPAERGTYGLQVMNDAGQVVYDSTWLPMRVRGMLISDGTVGQSQTLPAGPKYAMTFNAGGRAIPTGTAAGVLMTFGASVNGGVVALNYFQIVTITGGAVTAVNGPVVGLILDVTNY